MVVLSRRWKDFWFRKNMRVVVKDWLDLFVEFLDSSCVRGEVMRVVYWCC